MEKTIKCAECGFEFAYTPNPKYTDNRKYCLNCSAKKKAAFKQDKEDNIEREPVKPEYQVKPNLAKPEISQKSHDDIETLKKAVYDKHKVETKSNGFKIKLTEENIRIGALDCALKLGQNDQNHDSKEFWNVVKKFEKYIRFGE